MNAEIFVKSDNDCCKDYNTLSFIENNKDIINSLENEDIKYCIFDLASDYKGKELTFRISNMIYNYCIYYISENKIKCAHNILNIVEDFRCMIESITGDIVNDYIGLKDESIYDEIILSIDKTDINGLSLSRICHKYSRDFSSINSHISEKDLYNKLSDIFNLKNLFSNKFFLSFFDLKEELYKLEDMMEDL
jgi:hypothetical protein